MGSLPAWLTLKLAGMVGGVALVLMVLWGIHGAGVHAGKAAQEKRDAKRIEAVQKISDDWRSATLDWKRAYEAVKGSLDRLKAAQDAKVEAGERVTHEAVKRRPRAVQRSEKVAHAELIGTTLEQYEQADKAVVDALR